MLWTGRDISTFMSSHILFKFLLGLFFFKVDIVKIDILEENVFFKRWTIKTFNNVMTLTWIHLFTNCVKGKDYHVYLPPVSMIFISQEIKHIYIHLCILYCFIISMEKRSMIFAFCGRDCHTQRIQKYSFEYSLPTNL